MRVHGGTTDIRANAVPTPGSFGGLENREEVIAKPSTNFGRHVLGIPGACPFKAGTALGRKCANEF